MVLTPMRRASVRPCRFRAARRRAATKESIRASGKPGARDPDCPEGTPRESAETSKSALGGVVDHRGAGRDSDSTGPEGWDRMARFAEALSIRRAENRFAFPIAFLG